MVPCSLQIFAENVSSGYGLTPIGSGIWTIAFVKIDGETHYLWRAVDHEGEVLEATVTKKRDKRAALKLLRKLMRRYGKPETIVTDKLKSYGAAMKEIGVSSHENMGRWIITDARIRISRFDDENEECNASGECKVYRNS